MKRRPRRPRRFVLILLLLAFAWLPASGAAAPSVAGGAADVRLLVSTIESQHPSPFHGISKEALDAAGEALAARAEGMHRDQLIVELMRLVASLGERDGHSGIYPGDEHSPRLHLYPLKLYDSATAWSSSGSAVLQGHSERVSSRSRDARLPRSSRWCGR
jgi:hypothetical protein